MPRLVIYGLIAFFMFISFGYGQEKLKAYRVHYYKNYDFTSNQFSDKVDIQAIPFTDKYYKLYYSYRHKLVKAGKIENGQLSIYLAFHPNGQLLFYLTYLYDKQNRIYRIETFNPQLKLVDYQIYYYNPDNNLLDKIIDYTPNAIAYGERRYSYFIDGKIKKEKVYLNGQFIYEKVFEYDASGKIIFKKPELAFTVADLNNPEHIEIIHEEILNNPDQAEEILIKYGIDTPEKQDEFYLKAGKLEHSKGLTQRIPKPKFGKGWAMLDLNPELIPFDSKLRNKEYHKQDLINTLDEVTKALDAVVKEHNNMKFGQTHSLVSKLTDFAIKMIILRKYMNESQFTSKQQKIVSIYQTTYTKELQQFLMATQESRDMFLYFQPFQAAMTKQLRNINHKINQFIKVHNFLVYAINHN